MASANLGGISQIGPSRRNMATNIQVQRLAVFATVAGVVYNALFAFLAARGVPMNITIVIACEILIILTALGASALHNFKHSDILPLGYIYLSILLAIIMSLAHDKFAVDGLRNALIVTSFTLLGARANERTVRIIFVICALIALLVLIWEIAGLKSYATAFRPADFLAKTRGYQVNEFYEDVGLSIGTAGYQNRFSFGIFSGPRTSSIFLEQVGINCFAITMMIYLSSLWPRLSRWEVFLGISVIVLIILSNNARMATIMVPVILLGYFAFPMLPRYFNISIPIILLLSIFTLFQFVRVQVNDEPIGRLGVTYKFLSRLKAEDLLLGAPHLLTRSFDTGYGYIIASTTIFGAIGYWMYLTFVIPQDSVAKRRVTWGMNAYIYLWLTVGGTASFSIKTASLLWFLVGFIRVLPGDAVESGRKPLTKHLLGIPVARYGINAGQGGSP